MQRILLIVLGGFFLLTSIGQQIKCVSSTRYLIPNFTANWHRANEYCFYLGMQLAIVETPGEHQIIASLVKDSEIFDVNRTVVWLGASDLGQEGIFYWHATGLRLKYAAWGRGQPDDWRGQEDCLVMANVPNNGWSWIANDSNCTAWYYFVCENMNASKIDVF
ncbi:perlucin-like [Uranotaenia lowii]|uniref:perlucin-like n=1 Tax=Uranotaenia lowii TaxID=190385 RepID=UPI00247963FC|nr:perlucin-like [Uranotaenia lowii]